MIRYEIPKDWIPYNARAVAGALAEAKAAVLTLKALPYQRRWVEVLQQVQLKREVAGTSRIEGAEFTDRELDVAMQERPASLLTRSQRQAHAAVQTYRWIAGIPNDRPIDANLVLEIHRRIVTGADDDHCPPGQLRQRDQNVTFGAPRHRGSEGGDENQRAFSALTETLRQEYRGHDPIIQAFAAHYHLAAMHPFLDGNGRTARALEALMLQRAGLRDTAFIAMSNYYYDEKGAYLTALAAAREGGHDLTPFLLFALNGVTVQSTRLLAEIRHQISKELFRGLAVELFSKLESPRKRPLAERQLEILNRLLEVDGMNFDDLVRVTRSRYGALKNPAKALVRDLGSLVTLGAVAVEETGDDSWRLRVRLEWPTEITETEFFKRIESLPTAKTFSFLR